MKKIITILAIAAVSLQGTSQSIDDSVSMEPGYPNQVFYSLENGTVSSIDNSNWDIALAVSGQGAKGSALLFNDAYGELYKVPSVDTAAWATLDTAGLSGWEVLLNSDTSWTNGAFNKYRGESGNMDMGWGILNPSNNFWTFGDSLYVAKIHDGSYKKVWILSLKTGVWQFKYANLDGSNEQTQTITKTNYPNKNFVYFSMTNDAILDREPSNTDWELTFTKHKDFLNPPGMYLNVTSVFSNRQVWTAKANEADLSTALVSTTPQTDFTKNVINIGREWKAFSSANGGWSVKDTIAYFVYDVDSVDLYRIVFTDFGGSSTGKAFFNKELIQLTAIESNEQTLKVGLYPNPAREQVTLLIDFPTEEMVHFSIVDLSGKSVLNSQIMLNAGLNQKVINTSSLSTGVYLVNVSNGAFVHTQKLIIK